MTVIAKTPQEIAAGTASQSAHGAHSCNKVIPFFPLRYAVAPAEKGGFAYHHPNLEKGFPALDGYQYVLRALRDDDGYLYIFDPDNREQIICFVYRSPDGDTNGGERRPAQFQRLQLDKKFNATELVGAPLPFAYIPAYDHPPKQVVIWFADVLLSPAKLSAFRGDMRGIRTTLGTTIDLKPWLQAFEGGKVPGTAPSVKHTLRLEDTAEQQPVGLNGKEVGWSEYRVGARLPSSAALQMAQGPGSARLVVALHDPVGMASELNHRIEAVLTKWHDYNKDAARLLWVSEAIDALGANLARETELEAFSNDVVGSALPPGTGGGAANSARDAAYRKGLAAKRKLYRDNLNESARNEFLEKDAPSVAHYQRQLDAAAANLLPWGATYTGPGALITTVRDLYDWKNASNFVAGRGAFVRTLYGLVCSTAGTQQLAEQLTSDGPRDGTLFALALKGYPKADTWSATRQLMETTTDQLITKALNELNAVIKDIQPDAASRQLTAMTLLALMRGKSPVTPNALWNTRYVSLFEVAEGVIAHPEQVATKEVPSRLRREAGLKGKVNFRLSPLAQGMKEHITVMRLSAALGEADQARLRELVPKLTPRLSLWHGAKLGLGGLGVLSSITNTGTALSQLGQPDQTALVNSLNVTGSLLGIGGAQRGLLSAVLTRQRDLALLAGKASRAEELTRLADRADRWAISLAAGASLAIALKDFSQTNKQGPNERAISKIGIALQATSAVAGFGYIGAKLWTLRSTGLGGKLALQAIGRAAVFNAAERAALWFVDAPVALVITALQLAYTWNQTRVDKAKVADWIKQSCLGLAPTHSSAEEQQKYYEMFLKPQVDTDYKLGNIALEAVFPASRLEPRAQRDVAVVLPGWQPQISAYHVTQKVVFGLMTESAFNDPEKIEIKGGNGYLRLEARNLLGNTVVLYWPNGFTQPDLMLEMTN